MAGCVKFVGAGPGRPDLITVRGMQAIQEADVLLIDDLVHPEIVLRYGRPEVLRIYLGKRGGHRSVTQAEIGKTLVEVAAKYARVVRLKGGDPSIFGRLREELDVVESHNIPYEIVPGVTAASGASAYAGPILTERLHGRAVTFFTGTALDDTVDWNAAVSLGVVVVYMGMLHIEDHVQRLVEAGVGSDVPVMVIRAATMGYQKSWQTTLGELAVLVEREYIRPPALWIVGHRVADFSTLRWWEDRPLHGRAVLMLRPDESGFVDAESLRELGCEVVNLPTLRSSFVASAKSAVEPHSSGNARSVLQVCTSNIAAGYVQEHRLMDRRWPVLCFDGRAATTLAAFAPEAIGTKVLDWQPYLVQLAQLAPDTEIRHFCGIDRRPELQDLCAEIGLKYMPVVCYGMHFDEFAVDEAVRQLRKMPDDTLILATSPKSFAPVWSAAEALVRAHSVVAIGPTTQAYLDTLGLEAPVLPRADLDLVSRLKTYWDQMASAQANTPE